MRQICLWSFVLLLVLNPAQAGEDRKPASDSDKPKPEKAADKPKTPAEEFASLRDEFQKFQRELLELLQKGNKPELAKLIQQGRKRDEYGKRILELAVQNPKEPFAVEALIWIVVNLRTGPEYTKAFELLEANHVGDPKIGPACMKLAGTATPQAEKFLRLVLEKNSHNDPQAFACFGLAQTLKQKVTIARQKETSRSRQALETAYGKEVVQQVRENPEKTLDEAEALFGRVLKDYAEVEAGRRTLGENAIDSLLSMITTLRTGPAADEAADRLMKKYGQSEWMISATKRLAGSATPTAEKWLRFVLEKNPSPAAKAQACFGLAESLKTKAEIARALKEGDAAAIGHHEAELGKEALQKLRTADVDTLLKEAEAMYDRVIKDFSDVEAVRERLRESAEGELFELRHLGIGKVAPDIEGEDLDGRKFKLSDYRGKVVVLDFWGHW